MKIENETVVELSYRLFDQRRKLVESSDEEGPIRYRHGNEEILPGLEAALDGLEEGAEVRVTLAPEEAYGAHNPAGLVSIPRADLPEDFDYSPGDWIEVSVEDAPADVENEELEMRIVELHDDEVILDANHPLAGQEVTFEMKVLSVAAR